MSNKKTNPNMDFAYAYDSNLSYPNSIIEHSNPSTGRIHPTQKPVTLFEYLIQTYTNEGEIILDSCIGSGTTAVAAHNTRRKYIGFETDETYYKQSLERIERATNQTSIFDFL